MKNNTNIMLITLLISFSLLSSLAFSQNYDVEEITVKPYVDVIQRTGKLAFKRTLNLSFKSNGYLTKLSVDEGDSFKKDQLLASLNTEELMADKNATFAKLLQAKRNVSRIEKMITKKLSSEQELDSAQTEEDTARAAYQLALYNLEKAQVIAPFNGVVLARHTELGEYQTPGVEILQVAALADNWMVKVALTGAEIGDVQLGQQVVINLPRMGNIIGTVTKVPMIANTEGSLFSIEISLPEVNLASGVIAGQLAEVTINATSNQFVYQMPIEALVSVDKDGRAVVVTKSASGEITQQAYRIFKLDNRYVYLNASELDPALTIITRGWQRLLLGE